MAQQTAVQCLIDELRSGKNLQFEMTKCGHLITVHDNILDKILQMEKEQNDKWNEFLDAEKVLGISDVKTIERIQWYYNTYFNKTFGNK